MADYISQFTGSEIDSRLAKVPQVEAALAGKQATLVSGTNIKTVGGTSILGSGDIPIQAGDTDAVKYVAQTLTDAQKAQARANIDAASLADIASMDFVTVTTLPTASASTMGHIYLVGPDANDNYDRYFTQESGGAYSWVSLGSTQIDLSDYATKAEVGQLEAKLDKQLGRVAIPTTETGKKINTNGEIGSTLPAPTSNASYRYMKFPVVAGDYVFVNAKGGSAPTAWCFADAENRIISAAPYSGSQVVKTLIAPENSAWVVINDQSNSTSYYLSKDSLAKRVEDLENATVTSDNLWEVTKEGGYYNGEGVFVSSENHNSCQIKMIPGAVYRVVQQTTAAGGNYVRIFQLSGNTLTQVYNERTNGTDVNYTCLNDGNTYILQAIWDLRQTSVGDTEIYATLSPADWIVYLSGKAREFDAVAIDVVKNTADIATNTEDIAEINSELHAPNLWAVTTPGGFYNSSGTFTENSSYDGCQIYDAVNGDTYLVKMQTVSSGNGNYLRVYRVENGALTQIYVKQQIGGEIEYTVPDDGQDYMLQTVMRKTSADGPAPEIYDISEDIFNRIDKIEERISDYREIKILAIGNSYSRDAFMYFPFVLESMIPGVRISFGILYKGGCTLAEHYDYISNDTDYQAFDYYRTGAGWSTVADKNINYALSAENWDIILLQQRSYKSNDYATYQPYLNNIVTLLQGKVDYNFRLGWFLTPALNDGCPEMEEATSDEMFENILVAVQKLMDETAVEFCIPCGTAIQNARTTSLKNLGDTGGLMYDNLHLQEGIPCLIESYVAAIVIANIMGKPTSVFGNQIRPTDAWITSHGIIQRHGSSVGVTDANCYIAQKCAAIAVKKPYQITDLTELGI